MILKLYNKDMEYLKNITSFKDLEITDDLADGYKTLSFFVPYDDDDILQEEQKIITDDYIYVIKEVNLEDNEIYEVFCKPYFSTLLSQSVFELKNPSTTLENYIHQLLNSSDWTAKIADDVSGRYSLQLNNLTLFDALLKLFSTFGVEYYFDTLNKIIYVWKNRGEYNSLFVFDKTNLRSCQVQANTHDLITRLIPLGKNGITIQQVNGGKNYVENYEYTNDIIIGWETNSDIENAAELLEYANNKIQELAKPKLTYTIKLFNFEKQVKLGDVIRVIDSFKKLDTLQRINKIVIYPYHPEESYVEVGTPKLSFTKMYNNMNNTQNNINSNVYVNLNTLNQ